MQVKAFSLYDTKAGVFHTPFFMPHVGQAVRAAIDLGGDLSTIVGRHPADFSLYEIGHFDDATGILHSIPPLALGTVLSLLPPRPMPLPQPVGHDIGRDGRTFEQYRDGVPGEPSARNGAEREAP